MVVAKQLEPTPNVGDSKLTSHAPTRPRPAAKVPLPNTTRQELLTLTRNEPIPEAQLNAAVLKGSTFPHTPTNPQGNAKPKTTLYPHTTASNNPQPHPNRPEKRVLLCER